MDTKSMIHHERTEIMNLHELLPKPFERSPMTDFRMLLKLPKELVEAVTELNDEVAEIKATLEVDEDEDLLDFGGDEAEAESPEEVAEDSLESQEAAEPESDENVEAGVVAAVASEGVLYG